VKFSEILTESKAWLQRQGRLTYRALRLEFSLDDEQLDALKDELLYANTQVADDVGRGLVWTGDGENAPSSSNQPPQPQAPATYTPQHLAERIRAEQVAMESRGAAFGRPPGRSRLIRPAETSCIG